MTAFLDCEVYRNFFLVLFKQLETGEKIRCQISPNRQLNKPLLERTLNSHLLVGFNSATYDIPMLQLALTGAATETLKQASDEIILGGMRPRDFADKYRLKRPRWDHIDLMPIAPLKAGLKAYAGRLHCKKMQDLPIEPNARITAEQAAQLVTYCENDLDNTALLYEELRPQIALRDLLSKEYGQDLRSRSDAQVAEHVIAAEVEKLNGEKPKRPSGLEGTSYKYKIPAYISYQAPQLRAMLEVVRAANFVVGESGAITMPPELAGLDVKVGGSKYRMGIGGLHSSESCIGYTADERTMLVDRDVASYYPKSILAAGIYPQAIGQVFTPIYRSIIEQRLAAKKAGDNISLTARSAGTDMSGGPLTSSIVLDFTKYFNHIIDVNKDFFVRYYLFEFGPNNFRCYPFYCC